jgi:replicative DNA helicase
MDFTPPHNLDAEAALIGAAFLDPVVLAECGHVHPSDFYRAAHGDIWAAMRRVMGVNTDLDWIAVTADVHKHAQIKDPNLEAYLQEITASVPSSYGYKGHAHLVKTAAQRRSIIAACRDAATEAYAGATSPDTILGKLVGTATSLDAGGDASAVPLGNFVDVAEAQRAAGGVTGLRTGITALDSAIGGLVPGRLIVVGARPAQGKSSMIAQMAVAAMDQGVGVLLFSLEMSGSELAARMICSRAGLDSNQYMRGGLNAVDQQKARGAAESLRGPLYIDETCNLDIAEIRLRTLRYRARHGDLGLVVVDYLGLAKAAEARGDQRYLQVGAVSLGLKQLAKELSVPVVAAHQINRGAEHEGKQTDTRPKLAQLRESGNIEQDADQVLLIWPFNKDPRNGTSIEYTQDPRPVEVIVAKNRHGANALLYLDFHKKCTKFTDAGAVSTFTEADANKAFRGRPLTPNWTEKQSDDKE